MLIPKTITFAFFNTMIYIHPDIKNFEVDVPNADVMQSLWERIVNDCRKGKVSIGYHMTVIGFREDLTNPKNKTIVVRIENEGNNLFSFVNISMDEVTKVLRKQNVRSIEYAIFKTDDHYYHITIER